MEIKKIEISGFKSLNKLVLHDIGNFGILAGSNGSGKSNIFDALRFISFCITQGLNNALTSFGGFEYIHCFRIRKKSARTLKFYINVEENKISYEYSLIIVDMDSNPHMVEFVKANDSLLCERKEDGTVLLYLPENHPLTSNAKSKSEYTKISYPSNLPIINIQTDTPVYQILTNVRLYRIDPVAAKNSSLLGWNGSCLDVNGQNIGWNDTPFYWPVLLTQEEINPVMFAIDPKRAGQIAAIGASDILEGIDPADVIKLTYSGDLEGHFGQEGDVRESVETRALKETTASLYIKKDEDGNWLINPSVPFDANHDHGIFSMNGGKFPFIVRPYKYMLLQKGRDARADLMLLKLDDPATWEYYPLQNFNKDGDLLDRDTLDKKEPTVLFHAQDTITDKDLTTKTVFDTTVAQWEIHFHVAKVLKFRKNTIDWQKVFNEED